MANTFEVDLTPAPRILKMLGELDFKAWQCICELVDNSFDAFPESLDTTEERRIKISIPSARLRSTETIVITDNGGGMTEEQLTHALKAGFSNNNNASENKLGLFGMGFNVATARLGNKTTIVTAQADSPYKTQVTIDFRDLDSEGFITRGIRVPKNPNEMDWHGTEITVSDLRPEHCKPLRQTARIRSKLGKVYGRVLRARGIELVYDGAPCKPFQHCYWGEHRRVPNAKFDSVPAYIPINESLPSRRYCNTCWIWLSEQDSGCPSCSSLKNVVERKRTVKGWIGIQRYFDKQEYGFDLIRNGRVIKEWDKSLFYVENEENDELEKEYPIDGRAQEFGRIIGELEIDFVATTYAKDAFDINSSDWRDFVRIVRGEGPLRPQIAKARKFLPNLSPLARLYSAFKTQVPGRNNLVPYQRGSDRSALITPDAQMATFIEKFRDNDPEYQADDMWWGLITRGDDATEEHGRDTGGLSVGAGSNPFTEPDQTSTNGALAGNELDEDEITEQRESDAYLTQTYEINLLRGISIKVQAFRVLEGKHTHGFYVKPRGPALEFHYWPAARVFQDSLYTPADMLINELAVQLHTAAQKEIGEIPISSVEISLREKYFPELLPTISELKRMAAAFTDELRQHVIGAISEFGPVGDELLEPDDLENIRNKLAGQGITKERDVSKMLSSGAFLEGAPLELLSKIVRKSPALVFDGRFFSADFKVLAGSQTETLLRDFEEGIRSLLWLTDDAPKGSHGVWRGRQLYARAALEVFRGLQD